MAKGLEALQLDVGDDEGLRGGAGEDVGSPFPECHGQTAIVAISTMFRQSCLMIGPEMRANSEDKEWRRATRAAFWARPLGRRSRTRAALDERRRS